MNSTSNNPYLPLIITSTPFLINSTSILSSNSNSIQLLKSSSYILSSLLILLPFIFYQQIRILLLSRRNDYNSTNLNSSAKEFSLNILFLSIVMMVISNEVILPISSISWAKKFNTVFAFFLLDNYSVSRVRERRRIQGGVTILEIKLYAIMSLSTILHFILAFDYYTSLAVVIIRSLIHIGFDIFVSILLLQKKLDSSNHLGFRRSLRLSTLPPVQKGRTPLIILKLLLPQFLSIFLFLLIMILPIHYDYTSLNLDLVSFEVSKNILGTITTPIGYLSISILIFLRYVGAVVDLSMSDNTSSTESRNPPSPLTDPEALRSQVDSGILVELRSITTSSYTSPINQRLNPIRNSQSGRSLLSPSSDTSHQVPHTEVDLESPLAKHSLSTLDHRDRSYSVDLGRPEIRTYLGVTSNTNFDKTSFDFIDEVDLGLTFNGIKLPETPIIGIRKIVEIGRDQYITPPPSIRRKDDRFEVGRKFSSSWDEGRNQDSELANRFQGEVNPFLVETLGSNNNDEEKEEESTGLAIVEEEAGIDHSENISVSLDSPSTTPDRFKDSDDSPAIFYTPPSLSGILDSHPSSSPSSSYITTPPNSAPKLPAPIFHKRRTNIPSRLEFTTPPSSPFSTPIATTTTTKPYDPFPSPSSPKLLATTRIRDRDRYESISSIQSISPPSHLRELINDRGRNLEGKSSPSTSNESSKTIRPTLTSLSNQHISSWSSDSDSKSSTTPPTENLTPRPSPPSHSKSRSWSKKTSKKVSKGLGGGVGIRNSSCSDESFFCFSDKELKLNAIRLIAKDKLIPKKMVTIDGNLEVLVQQQDTKEEKVPASPTGLKGFRLSAGKSTSTIMKKKSWFNLRQDKENLEPDVKEVQEEEEAEGEENFTSTITRKLIPRGEIESNIHSKIIPLSRYSSSIRTVSISSIKSNLSINDASTKESKERKRKSTGSLGKTPLAYCLDAPYCPSPIGSFDLRPYSINNSARNFNTLEVESKTTPSDGETSFSNPSSRSPLTVRRRSSIIYNSNQLSKITSEGKTISSPSVSASTHPFPLRENFSVQDQFPPPDAPYPHFPNTPTPTSTTLSFLSSSTVPSPLFSGDDSIESQPSTPGFGYSENFPFCEEERFGDCD